MRTKIGTEGHLTIVFDAYHSGTADRNTDDGTYVRGTTCIFAPPEYVPQIAPSKVINTPKTGQDIAPITILSACLSEQVNYEHKLANGKYYGTLEKRGERKGLAVWQRVESEDELRKIITRTESQAVPHNRIRRINLWSGSVADAIRNTAPL